MLKLKDLASRPDFCAGPLLISPSRRRIEGPDGTVHVEPLIMQAFLLLVDTGDCVVTRDELFDQCWGGAAVGDDSLNRAIGAIRRALTASGGGLGVETIPRTGYRLTGLAPAKPEVGSEPSAGDGPRRYSRRLLIGGGIAAAGLAAVGLGGSLLLRPEDEPSFDLLMQRSEEALRSGSEDLSTLRMLQQATRLRPDDARAWGLLAYMHTVVTNKGFEQSDMGQAAEGAASKALAIDPREPNALTARALLQEWIDGWAAFDRRLREILAIYPANPRAMVALMALLQAAGLTRESWGWNEQLLKLEPLSPPHVFRKALKLWILGRTAEAYRVIDRATELWPANPGIWNARLVILAFTDRIEAALKMLDDNPGMLGAPAMMAVWRTSLAALAERSPQAIASATAANLEAAKQAPGLAAHGAMVLGALGQVDAAYQIVDGFLLSKGPVLVRRATTSGRGMITSRGWKWTQWLFTPACASLRQDRRFGPACEAIGLSDYWRARRVEPDFWRFG
jgi:DNA-binding winged helix-turn-helix (wHTH) protein/tetratricopeptide (TPR) repeat protein